MVPKRTMIIFAVFFFTCTNTIDSFHIEILPWLTRRTPPHGLVYPRQGLSVERDSIYPLLTEVYIYQRPPKCGSCSAVLLLSLFLPCPVTCHPKLTAGSLPPPPHWEHPLTSLATPAQNMRPQVLSTSLFHRGVIARFALILVSKNLNLVKKFCSLWKYCDSISV